ncbi:MAG TPA: hypothetical protein VLU47_05910, partial [Blastocatellia bacterium]|nr:hypothetical protein [Blastocatellia bacterium]
ELYRGSKPSSRGPEQSLILPQLRDLDVDAAYRQMAEDKTREAEALEWVEEMIGDADAMR